MVSSDVDDCLNCGKKLNGALLDQCMKYVNAEVEKHLDEDDESDINLSDFSESDDDSDDDDSPDGETKTAEKMWLLDESY